MKRLFRDRCGIGAACYHQRHFACGQGGNLHRVVADADARHDLYGGGGIHFCLFIRRAGQRDPRAIGQQRPKLGLANASGIDHRLDIVPGLHQGDPLLAHRVRQQNFAFVGGHGGKSSELTG